MCSFSSNWSHLGVQQVWRHFRSDNGIFYWLDSLDSIFPLLEGLLLLHLCGEKRRGFVIINKNISLSNIKLNIEDMYVDF
jgi:hypothetical protein